MRCVFLRHNSFFPIIFFSDVGDKEGKAILLGSVFVYGILRGGKSKAVKKKKTPET